MNKITKINKIIIQKRSNVIVSLDYENATSDKILQMCELLGKYVLGFKLHLDIISNKNELFWTKLTYLKNINNFIIIIDRKFCDIGNTVKLQSKKILPYCDLVTCHAISGPNMLIGLREECIKYDCHILLIAQMSSTANLIDNNYTQRVIEIGKENRDIVAGFICQEKLTNDFLHFTPGVNINNTNDDFSQQYNTPSYLVNTKGVDVLIVGRNIINSLINYNENNLHKLLNKYNKLNYINLCHHSCNNIMNDLIKNDMLIKGKEFILSSGQKSLTYYNLKQLISYPALTNEIALYLTILIQQLCQIRFFDNNYNNPKYNIILAGVPIGALPITSILSSMTNISAILVRNDKKNYGTQKQIEGNYLGKNIIIVEDVITTGNSVKNFIELIKNAEIDQNQGLNLNQDNSTASTDNINIIGIISVVNRKNISYIDTVYGKVPVLSIIYDNTL